MRRTHDYPPNTQYRKDNSMKYGDRIAYVVNPSKKIKCGFFIRDVVPYSYSKRYGTSHCLVQFDGNKGKSKVLKRELRVTQ